MLTLTIGILALQGDFERHQAHVQAVGAMPKLVRLPNDLAAIDGLIIPGGESTTMSLLLERFHLYHPLTEFVASKPVYGTCAGMILLAKSIIDNQAGVKSFGALDIDVERNGYGRQLFSFEELIAVEGLGHQQSVRGWFIRAPKVVRVGAGVQVLGSVRGESVLLRQNKILAASFHAELGTDTGVLRYFLTLF